MELKNSAHSCLSSDHSHCLSATPCPSTRQTLDELAFERGLWTPALEGDLKRIIHLVQDRQSSVNATDSSGYTALHYAARAGHIHVCRYLLEHGANPNARTAGGATPLHRAAYQQHLAIVQLLLDAGADPLSSDSEGNTVLHKAYEKGTRNQVINFLVQRYPVLKEMANTKGQRPGQFPSA